MAWPSAQDYNEAVQSPRLCFIDPVLQGGTVRLNSLGLPRPISGGFASVYEMTLPGSGGKWAIRCFLSVVDNQERRYAEISKVLGALRLPYTVGFRYQSPGIRVNGRALPIVSMEWLSGDQMDKYIQANFGNAARMRDLAAKWATMIADLHRTTVAHGDLQHGNVIIVNHEIKLVDYDGFYVPSLAGLKSTEDGHPNYQHPGRKGLFGPSNDNFSGWVVYCSLRILEVAPDVYTLSRQLGHDDCIIFNKEDYAAPALSPIFNNLRFHSNPTVVAAAACIERLLKMDVSAVPTLDPLAIATAASGPSAPPVSDWWKTEMPGAKMPDVPVSTLTDALPPEQPADVEEVFQGFTGVGRTKVEMAALAGTSLALFFLSPGERALGHAAQPLLQCLVVATGYWRLRVLHSQYPAASRRARLLLELVAKQESIVAQEKRSALLGEEVKAQTVKVSKLATECQQARAALTARQSAELNAIRVQLAKEKQQSDDRLRQLEADERAAIQKQAGLVQAEAMRLRANLVVLENLKAKELLDTLTAFKQTQLDGYLRGHRIDAAKIPGIGPGTKQMLYSKGIFTAADVTYAKLAQVPGLGPSKTGKIMTWRAGWDNRYANLIIQTLPASELARIDASYNARISAARTQLQTAQSHVEGVKTLVAQQYIVRREQLETNEASAMANRTAGLQQLQKGHAAQLAQQQQDAERERQNLIKTSTAVTIQAQTVAADLRRSQEARDRLVRRIVALDDAEFVPFLRSVFLTPFWPVPADPHDQTRSRAPILAGVFLGLALLLCVVEEMRLIASQHQEPQPPLTGVLELFSNAPKTTYLFKDEDPAHPNAIPGSRIGTGPLGHAEVRGFRRGFYSVTATSPSWKHPLSQQFQVAANQAVQVNFDFKRTDMQIDSNPPGATVSEEGVDLGVTPLTLKNQTAEPHTYLLAYQDWGPASETVDLSTQHTLRHYWPHGSVSVMSNPPGAHVMNGPRELGTTPLVIPNVKVGQVAYDLAMPGYETTRARGEVTDNNRTTLDALLPDIMHTGTVDVWLPTNSPTISIQNTSDRSIEVFEIIVRGLDNQLLDDITGPWSLTMGQVANVRLDQIYPSAAQVILKTNPKNVAITIRQLTPEVEPTPTPTPILIPELALSTTLDPRTSEIDFQNTGRNFVFITSITVKSAGFMHRERRIQIGRGIPPGMNLTWTIDPKLNRGDVVSYETNPRVPNEHTTFKLVP